MAGIVRSGLKIPGVLYMSIRIFSLLAIGLKGGIELAKVLVASIAGPALTVVAVEALIPLLAFPLLHHLGRMARVDAASIAGRLLPRACSQ